MHVSFPAYPINSARDQRRNEPNLQEVRQLRVVPSAAVGRPLNPSRGPSKPLRTAARKTGIKKHRMFAKGPKGVLRQGRPQGPFFRPARRNRPTSAVPRTAPPCSSPAQKTERPNRRERLGLLPRSGILKWWSKLATPPTVTLTFPNIAHKYWDNYRLTKEFYVRPAKD
jgi:hypothetical protein